MTVERTRGCEHDLLVALATAGGEADVVEVGASVGLDADAAEAASYRLMFMGFVGPASVKTTGKGMAMADQLEAALRDSGVDWGGLDTDYKLMAQAGWLVASAHVNPRRFSVRQVALVLASYRLGLARADE